MTIAPSTQAPKLSTYLLRALIALIILIPLWILFVMLVIQPASLMTDEQTTPHRLLWWVAGPLMVVAIFFSMRWKKATTNAQAPESSTLATPQASAADRTKQEFVLEVIGLGVSLDEFRQEALWDALQAGSPYGSIRDQDKENFPHSVEEKIAACDNNALDALENGLQFTPTFWAAPSFFAGAPIADPAARPNQGEPLSGLVGGAISSGLSQHLFALGPWHLAQHPDRILDEVFTFFDSHPDVPYIVLAAADNPGMRHRERDPESAPILVNGHSIPELPDASALFVLARRERVDALRPFVWNDPDNQFVQDKLQGMADDLAQTLTGPDRKAIVRPPEQDDDSLLDDEAHSTTRQPTVEEWLAAADTFARSADISGTGPVSIVDDENPWAHRPPKNWQPSPWFPIPWNEEQLATFDQLPTLGFIHRPHFIKLADRQGTPLEHGEERQQVLQSGWQQALQCLPGADADKVPARVIAASGGNTDQRISLHGMLNDYAAQGGPELTRDLPGLLIDTDWRLGDTGAATLFMQMAIGVMGSYRDGGISAAVNLSDDCEASVVFISPPSDELRAKQKDPAGDAVFGYDSAPESEPADGTENQPHPA